MVWRAEDPQGNEAEKIKYEIVRYTRGRGLDLGCGPSKCYPHFIGVDDYTDTKLFGIQMRPDVVGDCTKLDMFADGSMDFVFSSHLLEHIEDTEAALRQWWRVLKDGGYLVLYLPHRDLYPNIGQFGANPDHKHDFSPSDIINAMERAATCALGPVGFDLVLNQTRDQNREYSFLQVFQKIKGAKTRFSCLNPPCDPKAKGRACVVRYGGFGDMLQCAGVLQELKREGYHVTLMTTPKGKAIMEHDPHVDEFYLQDEGQVANQELTAYWDVQAKHYDKWIQLSESIEGTLLAMPGRANHAWPWEVRNRRLNLNYAEWIAELSCVPFKPEGRFYPSAEESEAAAQYLDAIGFGDKFNILFALSGSSPHKFYPGQDAVMQNILATCRDARFILVGDDACKILEFGWESHDRVATESGEMPIRSVLTLARQCNVVLGPETGVLNSVAYDTHVLKVVLLSHSSMENLTKHWISAKPIVPQGVKCYPCHQLHYGREYCPCDEETGAAMCQMSIDPARVAKPIIDAYGLWWASHMKAYVNERAA